MLGVGEKYSRNKERETGFIIGRVSFVMSCVRTRCGRSHFRGGEGLES